MNKKKFRQVTSQMVLNDRMLLQNLIYSSAKKVIKEDKSVTVAVEESTKETHSSVPIDIEALTQTAVRDIKHQWDNL